MRKVAIVGKADSTRHMAPFGDTSWEIWGLGWDILPRHSRLFEIHTRDHLSKIKDGMVHPSTGMDYAEWLAEAGAPVYVIDAWPEVPNAVQYPMLEVHALAGRVYLESSLAYMLALAILEGVDRVAIYGVDMNIAEEWGYQKPNMEFWIGLAQGKGVPVFIPKESALCRSCWPSKFYGPDTPEMMLPQVTK